MRVIDMNGDSRRAAPRKADGRRTAKEEAEKKEIPPSPPIGRKGEEESEHKKGERVRAPTRDACTRGPLAETPPDGVINHRIPPTLGVALWHAHHNIGFHDDAFVAEWYDDMVAAFWCDREGRPIRRRLQRRRRGDPPGAGPLRVGRRGLRRLVCDHGPDPVPPTPLWQRMVQLVLESATPEMRRVARAFTQCWNAEEAREKVKMTPWNFYRLRKKLKILLTPCFTEYREWLRRHRRVRGC